MNGSARRLRKFSAANITLKNKAIRSKMPKKPEQTSESRKRLQCLRQNLRAMCKAYLQKEIRILNAQKNSVGITSRRKETSPREWAENAMKGQPGGSLRSKT